MKIFVLLGCAQNPEEKLYLSDNAATFALDSQTRLINDFDMIGVEAAVRLMEQGCADSVTVFCLNGDKTLLHKALAIGATRAVMAELPDAALTPGIVVREAIAACDAPNETLFICGKLNVNFESAQTAQRLAAQLQCPCLSCAKKITPTSDGNLEIEIEDDRGTPRYLVHTPVVLTTDLRLAEPRFPSLPNIMKAKRKPISYCEISNTCPEVWDLQTKSLFEAPSSDKKCTFLGLQDAVKCILDAKFKLQSPPNDQIHPYSYASIPQIEDTQQPLSLLFVDGSEVLTEARFEQLKHFANLQHTEPGCLVPETLLAQAVELTQKHGVRLKVYHEDAEFDASSTVSQIATIIASLRINCVLSSHTPRNISILTILASAAKLPFCTNMMSHLQAPARMIASGRFIEVLSSFKTPFFATLSDTSPLNIAPVEAASISFAPIFVPQRTAYEPNQSEDTPEGAKLIFSIGRGAVAQIDRIRALAKRCGAAVGASRVVVDMGLMDNAHQVGLTGHAVAPNLYVAFGISGAIQHLAGLRNAPQVLAINTDKSAPIFDFAHFGVIADVETILSALEKSL